MPNDTTHTCPLCIEAGLTTLQRFTLAELLARGRANVLPADVGTLILEQDPKYRDGELTIQMPPTVMTSLERYAEALGVLPSSLLTQIVSEFFHRDH